MGETSAQAAERVGAGFTATVEQYEGALRYNLDGVRRLVASLPDGSYDELLDVGCGTGWATRAVAERFGTRRAVGVDPSAGMLEKYAAAVEPAGVTAETHAADVLEMPVADGSVDAVISTMAFHWFVDKAGATREMARALKPGGIFALLAGGEGVEREYRELLESLTPAVPERWIATYDHGPTGLAEMQGYLEQAGLEPVDIWLEVRRRQTPFEDFLTRMEVIGGHLNEGIDPEVLDGHRQRVWEATEAAADAQGRYEYTFSKLFVIARRPAEDAA